MATRRDAGHELEYAADLIARVVEGAPGVRVGVHVCRGNWSRREEVLLAGDYAPLVPAFLRMPVQQLVLEYATPRAGDVGVVGAALSDREIGLGVVNPRTSDPEPVEEIVAQVERALSWWPAERVWLNPDCGFGCFANRCVNDEATASEKLHRMVRAARVLRERHA